MIVKKIVAFLLLVSFYSCQPELENASIPAPKNISPVANAGNDTAIVLPVNSLTLTGTGSDVDGSITSYLWTKIAGPSSFNIVSASTAQTLLNNLTTGNYALELKVTDNLGAIGKDTVLIVVQGAVTTGTLAVQQNVYGAITPVNTTMQYDLSGHIKYISSNYYAERKITYKNGKISVIEYLYNKGNGSLQTEQTHNFSYDASNNVIKIEETDNIANLKYPFAEFTYNGDNTLKTKKVYLPVNGGTLVSQGFTYTNGNLTGITNYNASNIPVNTSTITYDNRVNTFPSIYNQSYFLDIQTVFAQTYKDEIFYFSKNYPVSFDGLAVSVTTNPGNQKPEGISFENTLWYKYIYN